MLRTVLIVDDVETCADMLAIVFGAMRDVDVLTARNGEDACRLLDDGAPPLGAIVTDLQMRGMDGFELIERVRAHKVYGTVPIIVITGSSDPDAPARVRALGANAFFSKPYSAALVREKMEQLLTHETHKL